jgi:uncharacterized protein (UPF0210 family)
MSAQSRTILAVAFLAIAFPTFAQKKSATPKADKLKIRAITAFVNLDRSEYQPEIADAVKMLKYARTVLESRGFEVQGVRISTQPFSEYTKGLTKEQTIAFFKNYDAVAAQDNFDASIGPAMLNADDPESQAEMLVDILKNTKVLNSSLVVAGDDGVRWRSVGAAARVIKALEDTPHSQGNFRFAALAMVPPLTPFFPGSYHKGFGHQFAIALQSANVVAAAFEGSQDLDTAKQRLTEALGDQVRAVEAQAQRIDRDTGWAYAGIDPTPAPLKEVSIGAALENLITLPFGSSGTLTAAATVTAVVKSIQVKQTGYSGLMLPILEDTRLAQRWSEGHVSIDALLSYSAVCGTGLDAVPLPGDISEERLDLIIGDMASLAFKWHKPLTARLLPVAGKGPGDQTDFDDPYLVNASIQPLDRK